LVKQVSGQLGT